MDRTQLSELHYIAPIDNVPSMLQRGLLAHRRADGMPHRSVAMPEIQEIRARVRIPGGRPLHDYVNLYVNGRNPMLFTVLKKEPTETICLLRVSTNVLDLPGTVIADQNAASEYVRFAHAPSGLALIDHTTVFATYWTHDDRVTEWRHKSAMCAEVLVPDVVPPDHVLGAYVGSELAAQRIASDSPTLPVVVDRSRFFG